ncbi:MAG: Unknown protein [uncultured Thiotrichaceae bacterium]|uniref:Glycine zipper 2TM domain-containing protein n=1 Tax=uncultured Thiotrichaceae bacterium TaxID=298394 RepID=A0A6S6ST28_9GAMM|nr:MAG: Unknown protein [uncultured Thiotrichaceae bacterium]
MTNIFKKALITTSIAASLLLTGCASNGSGGSVGGLSNEQASVLAGSVIGGVIGKQMGKGSGNTVATIAGAVIGGYIGGMMSNNSRQRTNYALDNVPNNQSQTWVEPQTNHQYTVTPTKTYNTNNNGQQSVCRDYTMDAYIDGRLEQIKGRACRNANGQWVNVQ